MNHYIRGPWEFGSPAQRRYERLERRPFYVGPHTARGVSVRNGRTVTTWKEPAAISCRNGSYHPKHGRVDEIRVVADDHPLAAELAAIDAERERLRERLARLREIEQDAIRNSWTLLPSVKVADLKRAQEEEKAATAHDG